MKDRYGREFRAEDIRNKDNISFVDFDGRTLEQYSEKELEQQTVLITDTDGGKRLYLISELQELLASYHYCRLIDPLTNVDILPQVPDFKAAIELEQNAAHYNAYVLNKYPEFIPLLITYVKETLNPDDAFAFKNTAKNDIHANKSEVLDQFYQMIIDMPKEKKDAFWSLFLTNRTSYTFQSKLGGLITFPAKWEANPLDQQETNHYAWAIREKHYTPYPHRNVRTGDFIINPEDGCIHTWGMDVLHLLLEYHIGTNKEFSVFNMLTNKDSYNMEQSLSNRIGRTLIRGSLDPQKGQRIFEQIKEAATVKNPSSPVDKSPSSPVVVNSPESEQMKVKLECVCSNYMNYLLNKLDVKKGTNYPLPSELLTQNDLLVRKYKAVYELYSVLKEERSGINNNKRIQEFTNLYGQKDRQEAIAAHRDSVGIRLLNVLVSILTLGVKNLITNYATAGYYGFWSSRGANLNEQIDTTLHNTPKID